MRNSGELVFIPTILGGKLHYRINEKSDCSDWKGGVGKLLLILASKNSDESFQKIEKSCNEYIPKIVLLAKKLQQKNLTVQARKSLLESFDRTKKNIKTHQTTKLKSSFYLNIINQLKDIDCQKDMDSCFNIKKKIEDGNILLNKLILLFLYLKLDQTQIFQVELIHGVLEKLPEYWFLHMPFPINDGDEFYAQVLSFVKLLEEEVKRKDKVGIYFSLLSLYLKSFEVANTENKEEIDKKILRLTHSPYWGHKIKGLWPFTLEKTTTKNSLLTYLSGISVPFWNNFVEVPYFKLLIKKEDELENQDILDFLMKVRNKEVLLKGAYEKFLIFQMWGILKNRNWATSTIGKNLDFLITQEKEFYQQLLKEKRSLPFALYHLARLDQLTDDDLRWLF